MNKPFIYLFLAILSAAYIRAYAPEWKIDFNDNLDEYSAGFAAGTGSPATDGYNILADIKQPPALPGAYIRMQTSVGGEALIADYRADLEISIPKKWEITLIAADPAWVGLSGTNTLTWAYNNTKNINLRLTDYGKDSARKNIVNTINLKQEASYEFNVTNVLGLYRYLNLEAENEFTMPLIKGWNLVSFPFNLTNKTVNKVFEGIDYSKMFTYINGEWIELKNNDTVNETIGIWINSTNNSTLKAEGGELDNLTFELNPGWNLIGYPYREEKNISERFNNTTVYMYNNSKWYSYVTGRTSNTLTKFTPGYGYWVKKI